MFLGAGVVAVPARKQECSRSPYSSMDGDQHNVCSDASESESTTLKLHQQLLLVDIGCLQCVTHMEWSFDNTPVQIWMSYGLPDASLRFKLW